MTLGCAFHGLNSLPLPGTVGRGPGAHIYHVEIAQRRHPGIEFAGHDRRRGGRQRRHNDIQSWHADVDVSMRPDVVVPANAVATVGQTSLLGSMHVALDPPPGRPPAGRLSPAPPSRSTDIDLSLDRADTVGAVAVHQRRGLGQIGDIIHNAQRALAGREGHRSVTC